MKKEENGLKIRLKRLIDHLPSIRTGMDPLLEQPKAITKFAKKFKSKKYLSIHLAHTLWWSNSWVRASSRALWTNPWCSPTFLATPCTVWRNGCSYWEPMQNAILRHEKYIHWLAPRSTVIWELMTCLKEACSLSWASSTIVSNLPKVFLV